MLNILFITEHSPFKITSGAHQRTRLLCTSFSNFSHIDVLSLEKDIEVNIKNCFKIDINLIKLQPGPCLLYVFIPPILTKFYILLKKFFTNIFKIKNSYLSKYVKDLRRKRKYDFIFVRYIKNLYLFGIKPDKSIIIDIDDLPQQVYHSKMNLYSNKYFIIKLYYFLNIILAKKYTKYIVKNVSIAYLANENQCKLYKEAVYLPNIPYIHNKTEKRNKSDNQIMFIGMIEYQPNYSGLEHFLKNIFPLIIKEIPDINLNIVGYISEKRKSDWLLKYNNISIHGFVDNLEIEYSNNSIIIVPVYTGGGTNIKVLEAMNMEKACVISSFAGRGFEDILINDKNILIADNDKEFAFKVVQLLNNKDYRDNIAKTAKETINNHNQYSFENFSNIIKKSILPDI